MSYKYECTICKKQFETILDNEKHIIQNEHKIKANSYKIKLLSDKNICSKIQKLKDGESIFDIIDKLINKESFSKISNSKSTSNVELILIHELTQFTEGKTEQTLKSISERYLLKQNETDNENEHLLEIICTNKSLAETKQWQIRTSNCFKNENNITIDILSSDKKSSFNSIDTYIANIFQTDDKTKLPNILIVCFHKQRIIDIIKLIKSIIKHKYINFKFSINFDEPDANLGVMETFLKEYNKYTNYIKTIQFITATPYDSFWKKLIKHNIFELLNISHKKINEQQQHPSLQTYQNYLDDYQKITNHNFKYLDNKTFNPLEYIETVYTSNYENTIYTNSDNKPYIDKTKRQIIFAPAHLFTNKKNVGSHEEVAHFFKERGFWVFLSNGKFKGFINPNGNRTNLFDFNKNNNIKGELRDTLRCWNKLYPKCNLAITGYWTIERGITFNTDGFNFTHMIISNYHKSNINKLVQLMGRASGNKKYVDKLTIICPKEIHDIIETTINKTIELRKLNPTVYNQADFINKDSAIPIKLTFIDTDYREEIISIIKEHKRGYIKEITKKIKGGIYTNKITIIDYNNSNTLLNNDKLIIRNIKTIRMHKKEDSIEKANNRRFKQFEDAHNKRKGVAQSSGPDHFCIDLTEEDYKLGDYTNKKDIAWITYNFI